jgi:hypothetical protein
MSGEIWFISTMYASEPWRASGEEKAAVNRLSSKLCGATNVIVITSFSVLREREAAP